MVQGSGPWVMTPFNALYCIAFACFLLLLAAASLLLRGKSEKTKKTVLLTVLLVALAVFCVNLLLRATGLHPKANYFYSVETEGNSLLEIFHRWIPVPFLYLLPSFLILVPYMLVITLPFALAEKRRDKNNEEKSA